MKIHEELYFLKNLSFDEVLEIAEVLTFQNDLTFYEEYSFFNERGEEVLNNEVYKERYEKFLRLIVKQEIKGGVL